MSDVVSIHAAFDEETRVWFVESSTLHGVNAEAPTLDDLLAKLPNIVIDLLHGNDDAGDEDVALDIVAHRRSAVRVRRAACGGSARRSATICSLMDAASCDTERVITMSGKALTTIGGSRCQ